MKPVSSCIAVHTFMLAMLAVQPASAHHSFAMYDQAQTRTFAGKLTRFIPGANHAQILFEVLDDTVMLRLHVDRWVVDGDIDDIAAPQEVRTAPAPLRMSDSALTVDIYRTVANAHMAHGLLAYIPEHRLLIQGDLFDVRWEVYFWGNTYEDNIAYRKLDVERDVPIHGRVLPLDEVRAALRQQTQNARDLCASVATAGLSMPGCPLAWDAAGP